MLPCVKNGELHAEIIAVCLSGTAHFSWMYIHPLLITKNGRKKNQFAALIISLHTSSVFAEMPCCPVEILSRF